MSRQMIVTPELQAYVDEVIALVCKRHDNIKPVHLLARRPNNQPLHRWGPYTAARVDVTRILRGTVAHDGWIRKAGLPKEWPPNSSISYPTIARLLGGLNHSGIIKGIAKMKEVSAPEVLTFHGYAGFGGTTMVRCTGDKQNDTGD